MVDSHGCGAETAQESGKWPSLVVSVVGDVMEVVHHLGGVILTSGSCLVFIFPDKKAVSALQL